MNRRLDKYTGVIQQYLIADQNFRKDRTTENQTARKRARQRYKRWRADLLADGVEEKSLDAAYMEACVLVTHNQN